MYARAVLLIALVLAAVHPLAAFAAQTVRWSEEVALRDGSTRWIQRTQVYGGWGSAGHGPMKRMEIVFADGKRRITWSKKGRALTTWPYILDWVDGRPVIVLEVVGWEKCSEYGFPPEGFAALRFDSGRWQPISVSALPRDLRANLFRNTEAIRLQPQLHGIALDLKQKKVIHTGPDGDERLEELIEKGSRLGWHSCATLRPPPDADREASRRRIAAGMQEAPIVDAVLASEDTRRYPMTREQMERIWGPCQNEGDKVCLPTDACGASVTDYGPLPNVIVGKGGHGAQLAGYEIVLDRRRHLDIPVPGPQRAACSPSRMLVIAWEQLETFVLLLFERDGSFIRAVRSRIPGLSDLRRDGASAWLLAAEIGDESALLTFVSYTQRQERTVERTRTYRVALPGNASTAVPPPASDNNATRR